MSGKKNIAGAILVITILSIGLSACQPAAKTPTIDPVMVYTQAAQTVQAGLTQTAALLPTSTPTETPQPTATLEPTVAATPTSAVSPTNTLAPTAARPVVADKAEWIGQNPADGTTMLPGQDFNLTWTVKNTGTTTWTKDYQVRFYLSDQALRFLASDIKFPKEVKPGESVDLTLPTMEAPKKSGEYTTIWVLSTDQGVNFYQVTLTIKVAGSNDPTVTPTP